MEKQKTNPALDREFLDAVGRIHATLHHVSAQEINRLNLGESERIALLHYVCGRMDAEIRETARRVG